MNTDTVRTALELIITRSELARNDALVALYAIQKKLPVAHHRYEHMLDVALSDASAQWTTEEKIQISNCWTETVDSSEKQPHIVRLTEADWERAVRIGNGNGSLGIRTAIRYHGLLDT